MQGNPHSPDRWRFSFAPLKEQPLVSVILTSYNYERYVGDAIRSVYAQTYRPVEIIVVDDGSKDRSRDVITETTRDAPVPTEVLLQPNAGQARALNAGFAKARGELVAFLDSDDSWRPDKLEKMVAFIRAKPDGGVYQHQLDDGAGRLKQVPLVEGDFFDLWLRRGEVNVAAHRDKVSVFLPTSGLIFRREVLERVFPIPEELVTCPDAYLTRASCVYGPLYSMPEVLGMWRAHEGNAGRRGRFAFRAFWAPVVMPAINRYYERLSIPLRFTYRPWAVLREPPVRIARILTGRLRRKWLR